MRVGFRARACSADSRQAAQLFKGCGCWEGLRALQFSGFKRFWAELNVPLLGLHWRPQNLDSQHLRFPFGSLCHITLTYTIHTIHNKSPYPYRFSHILRIPRNTGKGPYSGPMVKTLDHKDMQGQGALLEKITTISKKK